MITIFLGLLAIAAIALLWAVSCYNTFVRLKAMLDEAWSGIDVQLKRRYDLIPNLVATVQGYSVHEKSTLEEVTRMRSVSMHATDVHGKSLAEAGLSHALKTLFAVAERYPDLKANTNFLSLQKELTGIEQEVQLARRYYNGTARNYNMSVQSFPSRIIATMSHFAVVPYFELSSEQEREVPRVKF